ncbi:hypothetical protein HRbin07_00414 [bacterium HR07]|nr:hypothetical protein HRbin07_00414 [bacterium HR07]
MGANSNHQNKTLAVQDLINDAVTTMRPEIVAIKSSQRTMLRVPRSMRVIG